MGAGDRLHRAAAVSVHPVCDGRRRRCNIPAKRMLAITGAARMFRFTVLGVLACFYGKRILKWADSDVVQWILIGLVVLCAVGSIVSVIGWIKRSRKATANGIAPEPERAPSAPEPEPRALR